MMSFNFSQRMQRLGYFYFQTRVDPWIEDNTSATIYQIPEHITRIQPYRIMGNSTHFLNLLWATINDNIETKILNVIRHMLYYMVYLNFGETFAEPANIKQAKV
ncbi:hypothetical protein HHI36_005649 [Cryptolaemus montrouzieri]|uniref:Uncharacterized protein n=1 Tax=Cryptolaemus montrouzieri TaxID=559131 RepID=A0ABD2NV07_9CUCU